MSASNHFYRYFLNPVMKNLGTDPSVNCKFSLLEPERLESVGEPLEIPEACMVAIQATMVCLNIATKTI